MRKLIYIMGCANCGSTLLTDLISRHSKVATVGELKMTALPDDPEYLCGCGELLKECSFWQRVFRELNEEGHSIDFKALGAHFRGGGWFSNRLLGACVRNPSFEVLRSAGLALWPPARGLQEKVIQRNECLMGKICEVLGKQVFLDGSKDPNRLVRLEKSGRFDVVPVYLVRDGRSVVNSYKKRDPEFSRCLPLWKHKFDECEKAIRCMPPGKVHVLRYEDLCLNTSESLKGIFKAAGLEDESEQCLQDGHSARAHIIGHASRLQTNRKIRFREEWRTSLTNDEMRMFNDNDGGRNAKYGYLEKGVSAEIPNQGQMPGQSSDLKGI